TCALLRVAGRGPARLAAARRPAAHDDRRRRRLARGADVRAHRAVPRARAGARRVRPADGDRDRCRGVVQWREGAGAGRGRRRAAVVRGRSMRTKTEPASKLYLEDFSVGQIFRSGSRRITEAEIKAFAKEYDPQPFHLDNEAAKASMFGG